MPVEVKICGLTRPEDAATASGHGAAYLGVVFAEGPRVVTPARAAEIVSAGRGVPVFGVFGSQSASDILSTARLAGLSGAQLHGLYGPQTAAQLPGVGAWGWRGGGNSGGPG